MFKIEIVAMVTPVDDPPCTRCKDGPREYSVALWESALEMAEAITEEMCSRCVAEDVVSQLLMNELES